MLNGIKQIFILLGFLFSIFYPALRSEADESMEISVETGGSKTEIIREVDTRPIIEIETLTCKEMTEEDIQEEIKLGEMEWIAQLVEAEAGNQDLTGKRYVVDVVLNRVDSEDFPDTVEEVIFQDNQFSVIGNGAYDKAGWFISEESFEAVRTEYEKRLNEEVLYFGVNKPIYAEHHFKHQDHWFGW